MPINKGFHVKNSLKHVLMLKNILIMLLYKVFQYAFIQFLCDIYYLLCNF
jgi:hypothetical protein